MPFEFGTVSTTKTNVWTSLHITSGWLHGLKDLKGNAAPNVLSKSCFSNYLIFFQIAFQFSVRTPQKT
jgi:hypothetical protein